MGNPNGGIGQIKTRECRENGVNSTLPMAFHGAIDAPVQIKRERAKHRLMAEMSINGHTQIEIAKFFEIAPSSVSSVLRQPYIQTYMQERLQDVGDDFREQIVAQGKAAFARIVDLSETARSEQVKLSANEKLLDRYLGKAVQPIEQINKPIEQQTNEELLEGVKAVLKERGRLPVLDNIPTFEQE